LAVTSTVRSSVTAAAVPFVYVIVFVTRSGVSCGNGKNPKSIGAGVA
jgi:hypothetical protein